MSIMRLPSEHDTSYPAARGPVLLLSCMDPRLMDELLQFMDHDCLTNQYDHLTMAGAALGALGGDSPKFEHWRQTFLDHLQAAHDLHRIKDVYIVEHRDCGAYKKFLGDAGTFDDEHMHDEEECHRKYAMKLKGIIEDWAAERDIKLNVKAFLMDLRGRVALLSPTHGSAAIGGKRVSRKKG